MRMTDVLSPFVYWAQTRNCISLKIELSEAKNTNISLESDRLAFSAYGKGARGEHKYGFCLSFFSKVDTNVSQNVILNCT